MKQNWCAIPDHEWSLTPELPEPLASTLPPGIFHHWSSPFRYSYCPDILSLKSSLELFVSQSLWNFISFYLHCYESRTTCGFLYFLLGVLSAMSPDYITVRSIRSFIKDLCSHLVSVRSERMTVLNASRYALRSLASKIAYLPGFYSQYKCMFLFEMLSKT